MSTHRLGVLAALLLAGGAAAAALWPDGSEAEVVTVRREDFRVTVEATGKLEAAVAFDIGPPSVRDFWQYNLKWMIPEGSTVKKGDVIARFDTTKLDDRLRDYQAQLETRADHARPGATAIQLRGLGHGGR